MNLTGQRGLRRPLKQVGRKNSQTLPASHRKKELPIGSIATVSHPALEAVSENRAPPGSAISHVAAGLAATTQGR